MPNRRKLGQLSRHYFNRDKWEWVIFFDGNHTFNTVSDDFASKWSYFRKFPLSHENERRATKKKQNARRLFVHLRYINDNVSVHLEYSQMWFVYMLYIASSIIFCSKMPTHTDLLINNGMWYAFWTIQTMYNMLIHAMHKWKKVVCYLVLCFERV